MILIFIDMTAPVQPAGLEMQISEMKPGREMWLYWPANQRSYSCQSGRWEGSVGGESGMYAFFRATSCPTGWVKANGGNGTVDLRGQFVRAWDDGRGLDSGRGLASSQGDAIRNITGSFTIRQGEGSGYNVIGSTSDSFYRSGTSGVANEVSYNGSLRPHDIIRFDASRSVPTANENRPRNVALLACMKS